MAHPYAEVRQTKVEHKRAGEIAKGHADGGAVTADPPKRASGGAVESRTPITGRKNGGRLDRAPRARGGKVKARARGGEVKLGADDQWSPRASDPTVGRTEAIAPMGRKASDAIGEEKQSRKQHYARGGRTNAKKGATTVNVIIAPQGGDKPPMMPPPGLGAGPPPMPPKPMMPSGPPPGMAGPPGAPPIRHDGGRAYASGGAVKSGPAWEEGKRNGTQVSHSGNKMDGKDVGRSKPVTYAGGGAVPRLSGGARGGLARLEKERAAAKS
jgi:hypothetical protein